MPVDVIIPARNEGETIGPIMEAFLSHPNTGRLIVVIDPATTDNTFRVVFMTTYHAPRAGVYVIRGREGGKGQCVMQGLDEVRSDRVIFCDADLTGFGYKHVESLMFPTLSNDQVILVPGSDRPLPERAADAWPWVSGERNVPTWIAKRLNLHGYLMETQINHAMWVVGGQTTFVSAPDVIAEYDLNDQRLAELRRDFEWARYRGIFK